MVWGPCHAAISKSNMTLGQSEDVRILVEIRRLSEFFSRRFRSVLPGFVALQQKYLAPGSFIGRARGRSTYRFPPNCRIMQHCRENITFQAILLVLPDSPAYDRRMPRSFGIA